MIKSKRRATFSFVLLALSAAVLAASASAESGQEAPCGFVESDCADGPRLKLSDGATSVEALVDDLLRALEKKDLEAIHRLRVTKDEYQQIIAPGTFSAGETPKRYSPAVQKYFWEDLDFKNRLYAENLIKGFGGRSFPAHEFHFTKPTREYGWYRAYGELRVELETPPSVPEELSTGWIAEVDGRFKFIGFGFDD